MKRNIFFLLSFFLPGVIYGQNYKIRGVIVDSTNKTMVDYANIGIEGKNLGTVSNDSGYFELEIPDKFLKDSLTFSRIGYATQQIFIGELIKQNNLEINFTPKTTEIQEAKIVSRKLKHRTRGNKVRKSVIKAWYAFYADPDRLGHEVGTVIHIPNKKVFLKNFNFQISSMYADSVRLRLNIYDFKDELIGDNLLNRNFYFVVRNNDIGDYHIDLSELKIFVSNDIFVSIENVAGYTSSMPAPKNNNTKQIPFCSMLFRGTMTGSKSFSRNVSLGKWEEFPATLAPCFWVTILK